MDLAALHADALSEVIRWLEDDLSAVAALALASRRTYQLFFHRFFPQNNGNPCRRKIFGPNLVTELIRKGHWRLLEWAVSMGAPLCLEDASASLEDLLRSLPKSQDPKTPINPCYLQMQRKVGELLLHKEAKVCSSSCSSSPKARWFLLGQVRPSFLLIRFSCCFGRFDDLFVFLDLH